MRKFCLALGASHQHHITPQHVALRQPLHLPPITHGQLLLFATFPSTTNIPAAHNIPLLSSLSTHCPLALICWLREKFFFAAPHLLALSHTLMPRLPALLGALPLSFVLFSHLVTASYPADDVSSPFAGDMDSTTGDTSKPHTSITSNRHILASTDVMFMFEAPLPPSTSFIYCSHSTQPITIRYYMYYKTSGACHASNLVQVDILVHGACYSPEPFTSFSPKCMPGNAFKTEQVCHPLKSFQPPSYLNPFNPFVFDSCCAPLPLNVSATLSRHSAWCARLCRYGWHCAACCCRRVISFLHV
jgi:hypothetical protein